MSWSGRRSRTTRPIPRSIAPLTAEYFAAAILGGYVLYLVVRAIRTDDPGDFDHPLAILGLPMPLSLDNLFAEASLGALG